MKNFRNRKFVFALGVLFATTSCSFASMIVKPKSNLAFSFHVGSTYPLSNLDDTSDSNIHVSVDMEYQVKNNHYLIGVVGLNQFTAESASAIEHPRWINVSANYKITTPLTAKQMIYYIQGGIGQYFPKSGSSELGANIGIGAQIPLNNYSKLEFGGDYHYVNASEDNNQFLTFKLGVVFPFSGF
jgi:hypothetical protein